MNFQNTPIKNPSNSKSTFAPHDIATYEQFVFDMEKSGINDLVARDKVDFTFRPPAVQNPYTLTVANGGNLIKRA